MGLSYSAPWKKTRLAPPCARLPAPLGGPLELELRGYRLSIRRHDAARVAIAK